MAGELLLDRPADGVLRLTISNPAKRNALDHAILDAIAAALDDLGDSRALLLTGADGMFSSGYDIGDIPDDVFPRTLSGALAARSWARSSATPSAGSSTTSSPIPAPPACRPR